jgi:type IV secretion system protein TrbL
MQSQKSAKALWMLLLPMLLLVPSLADAATSIGLSSIMSDFQSTTQGWYHAIFTDALGLFAMLFGVEFTWMVTTWLIGGKDVHEIFTSLVKKLISIAFFYTLLLSSAQIIPDVTNGFRSVAASANGAPVTTVSDIAMTGVRSFVTCVEGGPQAMAKDARSTLSKLWHLNFSGAAHSAEKLAEATASTVSGMGIIAGLVTGFILLLSFIYVALELVAVQLESMIVLSAGVIMLGFGAARWTTGFVESYLKYALAVGVRLMVLTLWASFIEWQVNPLIHTTLVNGNASPEAYAIVIILALLVAWLTKKLPGFAGSILSGNSTLSGGEMFDAVKKGMIAAGMAATGGAALIAGGAAMGASGAMGAAEAAGAGAEGAGALSAAEGAGAGASAGSGAGGAAGRGAAGAEGAPSVPAPSSAAQPAEEGVQPPKAPSAQDAQAKTPSDAGAQPMKAADSSSTAQTGSQQQKTETTGAGASDRATSVPAGASGNTAAGGGNATSTAGSATTPAGSTPAGSADSTATAGSGDVSPTETASTAAPASDSATSSGSAPSTEKPADPVDHRPSAPNAPSETPAGSGGSTQPTAPTAPSSRGTSGGGQQQVEAPGSDSKQASPWDVLKQGHAELKEVKEMHKTLSEPSIGSHESANVSAPNLGVGHIKD